MIISSKPFERPFERPFQKALDVQGVVVPSSPFLINENFTVDPSWVVTGD